MQGDEHILRGLFTTTAGLGSGKRERGITMKPKTVYSGREPFDGGIHPGIDRIAELVLILAEAAFAHGARRFQALALDDRRRRAGAGAWTSLRPGERTPLWNELRRQLRPHLRKYGSQAALGRLLGLPRQQINAFVTGGGRMPDAERTLLLQAWLVQRRRTKGRRQPSTDS
jgi:hypothetical protein